MITKTCAVSGQTFTVTDDDLKFYEKMGVPAPTLCPEERNRRRMAFRNERFLYRRKCDATGKSIISFHNTDSQFPVYDSDYWWSDHWDAADCGQEFDFYKPFFPQFSELYLKVPKISLLVSHCENAPFSAYSVFCKNCYMAISCVHSEDVLFSYQVNHSRDCFDSSFCKECELCYECLHCVKGYNLKFCEFSENCSDSWFLKNCIGCQDCFGCVNLRNKKYYFLNEKYSPEAYTKKLEALNLSNYQKCRKKFSDFQTFTQKFPHRYFFGEHNENAIGNYIFNSKNIDYCFDVSGLEDSKYIYISPLSVHHCYDLNNASDGGELCLEGMSIINQYNSHFCLFCWDSRDIDYCVESFYCRDCFGCTGLKKAQHCILNKSYTKHEYESLKKKIIEHMKETGEWGEFFPISLSPFAYNETVAQEYFPLTKEEVLKRGYKWRDEEIKDQISNNKYQIPDNIADVPDSITDQTLTCEKSGKPYKIQKAELKFYRKMNLPIPHLHPDIRHQERMALRNPRKLWTRKCDDCQKEIQTTYAPERPEKVLCEACYLKIIT